MYEPLHGASSTQCTQVNLHQAADSRMGADPANLEPRRQPCFLVRRLWCVACRFGPVQFLHPMHGKMPLRSYKNTGGLTVAEPTFPSFGPVNAKSLTQKFDPALSVGKRDLRRQIESPESIGLLATLQKFAVQDAIEDPFNKYCKSVKRLSRQETPNSVGG